MCHANILANGCWTCFPFWNKHRGLLGMLSSYFLFGTYSNHSLRLPKGKRVLFNLTSSLIYNIRPPFPKEVISSNNQRRLLFKLQNEALHLCRMCYFGSGSFRRCYTCHIWNCSSSHNSSKFQLQVWACSPNDGLRLSECRSKRWNQTSWNALP